MRSNSLQVITAADGRSGISLYREREHDIGLIILDLSMPGLSGVETFTELQKIRPDAPVVLMSGYSEEEVTHRFQNLGVMGFLKKPFRVSQLLDLVSRHMAAPPEAQPMSSVSGAERRASSLSTKSPPSRVVR